MRAVFFFYYASKNKLTTPRLKLFFAAFSGFEVRAEKVTLKTLVLLGFGKDLGNFFFWAV